MKNKLLVRNCRLKSHLMLSIDRRTAIAFVVEVLVGMLIGRRSLLRIKVKGKGKGQVLDIALLHDEHMLRSALQSQ